jgi:hypothetical protein
VSVDEKIATLEDLVSKMKYVAKDQYVLAEHTNLFADYLATAVQLLKDLYELFKAKAGRALPNAEQWISMAESRAGLMRKVKFGDIALTKDHNLVIDTLKPVELALREIEANL